MNRILPITYNSHGDVAECQLCGEPADDEMGEFTPNDTDPSPTPSIVAHGQCGLDHGMELA